jgi:cell division control protein 24
MALMQYEIYLFERILLCCVEISIRRAETASEEPRGGNINATLELVGRIFLANVTDIVSLSKPGKSTIRKEIYHDV